MGNAVGVVSQVVIILGKDHPTLDQRVSHVFFIPCTREPRTGRRRHVDPVAA